MKVAPTVLAGGKGGDNVKPLPICHEEESVEKLNTYGNASMEYVKGCT